MGNHKTKSSEDKRPTSVLHRPKLVPVRSPAEECRCLVYQWFALSQWLPVQCDRDAVCLIAHYLACLADPFLFLTECASLEFATYCYAQIPGNQKKKSRHSEPIRFRQACVQGIPPYWRCETWLRLMEEEDFPSVTDPARKLALEQMRTEYWAAAKEITWPPPPQDHTLICIGRDVARTLPRSPVFGIPAMKDVLTRVLAIACRGVHDKLDSNPRGPNADDSYYYAGMNFIGSMFLMCSLQSRFARASCNLVANGLDTVDSKSPFSATKGFLELLCDSDDANDFWASTEPSAASEYFEALWASADEVAIKLREDIEFDAYRLFSLWLGKMGVYFYVPDHTQKLLDQMDLLLRYSEVGLEKTLLNKFDDSGYSMMHFYRWMLLGFIADLPTGEVMKYWDAIISLFHSGRSMNLVMYLCACILSKRTQYMRVEEGEIFNEIMSLLDLCPMTKVWSSNDYRETMEVAYHLFSLDVVHDLGPDATSRK